VDVSQKRKHLEDPNLLEDPNPREDPNLPDWNTMYLRGQDARDVTSGGFVAPFMYHVSIAFRPEWNAYARKER
jgi:hypothetical protein